MASPGATTRNKPYDYLLKFLLVGDSDVGKEEIMSGLEDGASESPYGGHSGRYRGTFYWPWRGKFHGCFHL